MVLIADGITVAEAATVLVGEAAHVAIEVRIAAWRRLVRSLFRIRRLQRIWGNLGQHLQTYPSELRKSLQDHLPKRK